jgi:hypothetical protein
LRGYRQLAVQGQRQLVFVTGEAGIGKTALADAFQHQAALAVPGLRLACGQCVQGYGGTEPCYPMLEALGQWCRGGGGDAVVQTLAAQAPTWLVQFLALLTRDHRALLQQELLSATRERMLREICAAPATLTATSPLVLVFEDLQWVDPATVDLLAALARRRVPAKLLLLATYRPMDVALADHPLQALTPELLVHQLCHELAVEALREADVTAYLAGESPGVNLPEGLAGLVYRHSEGNPLFMVAALDYLTQRGLLIREDDSWHLRVPLEDLDLRVPKSLRHMIEAQIGRLSTEEQRAMEGASIVGVVFSTSVSAAATNLEAEDSENLCDQLARRHHLVRAAGMHPFPDGSVCQRYAFVHALYREVCYGRVAAGRRARLHRRIGERLEALYTAQRSEVAAELAYHFEAGAAWTRRHVSPACRGHRWTAVCLSGSGHHAAARARPGARQHLEACIARYTPDQRRAPVFRIGADLGVGCRASAAFLSTVMTRGVVVCLAQRACRKKHSAAVASRVALSRKSMVWPVESTAR